MTSHRLRPTVGPRSAAVLALVAALGVGCTEPRDPEADAAARDDWCARAIAASAELPVGPGEEPDEAAVEGWVTASEALLLEPRPAPIEEELALLAGEGDLEEDAAERRAQLDEANRSISAYASAVCRERTDEEPDGR